MKGEETMNEKSFFEPGLVFWGLRKDTAEECLEFLGKELTKAGKAKADYTKAVLEREAVYPTGLETPSVPIAIPHANPDNALENALAVAKLERPVMFRHMADEEQEVPVELIMMMCIAEPQMQVPMLSRILSIFTDGQMEKEIHSCKNAVELYELLLKKTENRKEDGG